MISVNGDTLSCPCLSSQATIPALDLSLRHLGHIQELRVAHEPAIEEDVQMEMRKCETFKLQSTMDIGR